MEENEAGECEEGRRRWGRREDEALELSGFQALFWSNMDTPDEMDMQISLASHVFHEIGIRAHNIPSEVGIDGSAWKTLCVCLPDETVGS